MSAAVNIYSDHKITDELWRRGELSWKLRPEQKRLKYELEAQIVQIAVFNISRRWGKTFTLVVYCLEQCIKSRERIRYGAAFKTDLEEFVLPAFEQILEDCPPDLRPKFIATKKMFKFANGSEIKLVGLDKNPNGLRGNAISKIIIDEAAFVSKLRWIYVSVIIPATMKQKGIKLVFISTPPESPEHFFVDLINKAKTQSNGYYLELSIDDISDLTPEERERVLDEVGGEFSTTAQREFFCQIIIDASRAIAPEFNEERHVFKDLKLPDYYHSWVAADFGGIKDMTAGYCLVFDFERGKVLVTKESAHKAQTGTTTIIKGLRSLETLEPKCGCTEPHNGRRYVDAPGQTHADFRVEHNYNASLPDKTDFETGINSIRLAFQYDKLEIDEDCTLLIQTLKTGMLNAKRTDFMRTDSLGHMDAVAALIYGYRHRDQSNPFPNLMGLRRETHYTENAIRNDKHKQALESAFK